MPKNTAIEEVDYMLDSPHLVAALQLWVEGKLTDQGLLRQITRLHIEAIRAIHGAVLPDDPLSRWGYPPRNSEDVDFQGVPLDACPYADPKSWGAA